MTAVLGERVRDEAVGLRVVAEEACLGCADPENASLVLVDGRD